MIDATVEIIKEEAAAKERQKLLDLRATMAPATAAAFTAAFTKLAWERDFNERRWRDCAAQFADLQKRYHELTATAAKHGQYLRQEQAAVDQLLKQAADREHVAIFSAWCVKDP